LLAVRDKWMAVFRLVRPDVGMALVRLALVAVGALIAADAANQWLLSRWQMPVSVGGGDVLPEIRPRQSVVQDPFGDIVVRNVFNSNPSPPESTAPPPSADQGPAIDPPIPYGSFRLTGTVVGPTPNLSFGIIMNVARREEQVYRIGDQVDPGIVVVDIQRDSVRLKRGGAELVLRLFDQGTPEGGAPLPPGAAPPGRAGMMGDSGQTRFTLDRGMVEESLSPENLPRLLTQARLLPNFRAGQTDGFRVFAIQPDSLFAKIGLQNGDVLHQINDVSLENPTQFLSMFESLRSQSHITVDLVRGTERKTLEYEIR